MKQLNIFEKPPREALEKDWFHEHIKNPPPKATEQQKQNAKQKLLTYSSLRAQRSNLSIA